MPKIAIIIPCYNEELTIANVISDCKKYLPEAEIYVCDNNSTDDTAKTAKELGAVVMYEIKQGKGNVVRKMFRNVDADCYVMIDGDGAHPATARHRGAFLHRKDEKAGSGHGCVSREKTAFPVRLRYGFGGVGLPGAGYSGHGKTDALEGAVPAAAWPGAAPHRYETECLCH